MPLTMVNSTDTLWLKNALAIVRRRHSRFKQIKVMMVESLEMLGPPGLRSSRKNLKGLGNVIWRLFFMVRKKFKSRF